MLLQHQRQVWKRLLTQQPIIHISTSTTASRPHLLNLHQQAALYTTIASTNNSNNNTTTTRTSSTSSSNASPSFKRNNQKFKSSPPSSVNQQQQQQATTTTNNAGAAPKRLSMIRVGINGSSIAGLTTALTMKKYMPQKLTHHGLRIYTHLHAAQSVESDFANESQAAILNRAAMDIFHKLGVGEKIEKAGKVMNEQIVRSYKGDSDLARVSLEPAVAIRKSLLVKILTDALKKSSAAENSDSENYTPQQQQFISLVSNVSFSTKSMSSIKRNESSGRFETSLQANFSKTFYDVIVGAEDAGMESIVKENFFSQILKNEEEATSDVETVMGMIPKPYHLDTADKIVEWWGNRGRLGCFLVDNYRLCVYSSVKTPGNAAGGGKNLVGASAMKQLLMASKDYRSKGTQILLACINHTLDEHMTSKNNKSPDMIRAVSNVKRGYRLKNPTDGKNVVLIGEAGYALNDAMFLSSSVDVLNGFELGRQLQQCDPIRGPQEAINIYVAKSKKLIEAYESEASRYTSSYTTAMPVFLRNLRLKSHKAIGSGPGSAVSNAYNLSTIQ